jgi:trans-2,3-dihydro-3-hydroxyanthranilate isomerase
VDFAGHPTIGTAIALAQSGRGSEMVLELGVGPIPCKVTDGDICTAEFTTTEPLDVVGELKTWLIAKCLGLAPEQIKSANHVPTMAGCGLPFMLVELPDLKTLSSTAPDFEAFAMAEDAFPNQADLFATYAYVRNGDTISTRMFAPLSNITEDPATGSAAVALGSFLTQQEQSALSLTIHQGFDMGRPSYIGVKTSLENGVCSSVTISGAAIKTMEGHLTT